MGGSSVPADKRPFAQNHQLAAEAGRKGGMASGGRHRNRSVPVAADQGQPTS